MKLYVCYGTFTTTPRPGGHPCGTAYHALRDAGHDPEVVRSYGLGILPEALNQTRGRKRVRALTGQPLVPALELDDGSAIAGSQPIVEWARTHPRASAA